MSDAGAGEPTPTGEVDGEVSMEKGNREKRYRVRESPYHPKDRNPPYQQQG